MDKILYDLLKCEILFTQSLAEIRDIFAKAIKATKEGKFDKRMMKAIHSRVLQRREFLAKSLNRQGRK